MNDNKLSTQAWQWTDVGVLSNEEGIAVLDIENWNVDPENAVLIQSAPALLRSLRDIRIIIEGSTFDKKEAALTIIDSAIDAATKTKKY